MSNNYVPDLTALNAGDVARASDINTRYTYVVSGFDLLPDHNGAGTGFSVPVIVGEPTASTHAATKNFVETGLTSQLALATTAATNASNSASAAATSESNASTSESNASASASSASISASNASTSEGNAATSESNAATSETNAAASALSASNSANAAEYYSNATLWVSGNSYVSGDVVYSPITFFSYRANTATSGTTDPSLSADWTSLGFSTVNPTFQDGTTVTGNPVGDIVFLLNNTYTGGTASAIFQINANNRYVNYKVTDVGDYALEAGSSLPTKYTEFDTHIFRAVNQTELINLNVSNGIKFGRGVGENNQLLTSSSGTANLDSRISSSFYINLTENTTITFTNPPHPTTFVVLWVVQGATPYTITWSNVSWPGGITPTLSSGPGDTDIFVLQETGSNLWKGSVVGLGY